MGLANVTRHQPEDPINYLANFLMQYRFNEIRYEEQLKELDDLLVLREQIQQEEAEGSDEIELCGIERKKSDFQ